MAHDVERSQAADLRSAYEQAEYAATHDPLTQVLNIQGLNNHLATLDSGKEDTAMLFVDGDHIKNINETLGHAAGDRAIIGTADMLRQCTRPEDIVARIGGDEFVVILSKDKRDAGNKKSLEQIVTNTNDRLRLRVGEFQEANPHLNAKGFDLSVGAAIRKPGDNFDDTKAMAEARMREHKQRQTEAITSDQQLIMGQLAVKAIAAGISPRQLANYLRTSQPDESTHQS